MVPENSGQIPVVPQPPVKNSWVHNPLTKLLLGMLISLGIGYNSIVVTRIYNSIDALEAAQKDNDERLDELESDRKVHAEYHRGQREASDLRNQEWSEREKRRDKRYDKVMRQYQEDAEAERDGR